MNERRFVYDDFNQQQPVSYVDLAEEIVGTVISQNAYNANLKMVEVQDEMVGTLIDMLN